MAKVKEVEVILKVSLSGDSGSFAPKDVYKCSVDEAQRLIAKDFAEPFKKSKK